jgi:hypothetical protein
MVRSTSLGANEQASTQGRGGAVSMAVPPHGFAAGNGGGRDRACRAGETGDDRRIGGAMVEPVTLVKGLVTACSTALAVRKKLEEIGPTARLREAAEIEQRSWRVKRDAEVEARLAELERSATDQDAFRTTVADMINDRQFLKVHANLEWEALRESLDERREMLAYAAAGLSDPGVPINVKARIERTLRELDPEHIELLARLERQKDPTFQRPSEEGHVRDARQAWEEECAKSAENRFLHWNDTQPVGHVLSAAGCVYIQQFRNLSGIVKPGLIVTELGRWVLKALESYLRSREARPHA